MSIWKGKQISVNVFGQSHAEELGIVIEGLEAGIKLDLEYIERFLLRRRGDKAISTKRSETDTPRIVSGLVDGCTCGAPLCAIFENKDCKSVDYDALKTIPRPSHSDYTAYVKFNGNNDIRGGGQFSGRMTLPLCFGGAIFSKLLEEKGIHIGSTITRIAEYTSPGFDSVNVTASDFKKGFFPVTDHEIGNLMLKCIKNASVDGDSVGGIVETAVIGLPVGMGDYMFGGMESLLSQAIFGIPAVKGIEFGNGFESSTISGSANNDSFTVKNGKVVTATNNCGGILGGITNGMPLIFRTAIKPTPSIAKKQDSVNLRTMENIKLSITGRHDPCIVPRAIPCLEAVTAMVIYDLIKGESAR